MGGIALEFMERAFEVASHGVAIREAFLQGAASRHRAIRRTRADESRAVGIRRPTGRLVTRGSCGRGDRKIDS